MYERSHVNIKVEPHSTFTFMRHSYIASISHKNKYYTTVEIHLYKKFTLPLWEPPYLPPSHPPKCTRLS